MKKKALIFLLAGIVALGLAFGAATLLIGAAPDRKTTQEIAQVVQDYYSFLSAYQVWPTEYRHLKKLPDDVKKRIAKTNKAKVRELTAGQEGESWARSTGEIFTGGYEPYGEREIDGGSIVLSIEDLGPAGFNKVQANAIVWSWQQVVGPNAPDIVDASSVPKTSILYVERIVLQKIDGKWKIVERKPFPDLGDLREWVHEKKQGFGPPSVEEARRLYRKLIDNP